MDPIAEYFVAYYELSRRLDRSWPIFWADYLARHGVTYSRDILHRRNEAYHVMRRLATRRSKK